MKRFEVLRTNHTSFVVSSLDRSLAFFKECLGFEVISRAGRDPVVTEKVSGVPGARVEIAFLQGPGHRLELIEYSAPADRGAVSARPCDTGVAHIAFDVSDVEAAVEASARYGVLPIAAPITNRTGGPNEGAIIVYLRDSDGIMLEFIQPPQAHNKRSP